MLMQYNAHSWISVPHYDLKNDDQCVTYSIPKLLTFIVLCSNLSNWA